MVEGEGSKGEGSEEARVGREYVFSYVGAGDGDEGGGVEGV